jgi:hypothetical protein
MYTLSRTTRWENDLHGVGGETHEIVWFHDHQRDLAFRFARTAESRSTQFDACNGGITKSSVRWFGRPRRVDFLSADTREIEMMHEFNGTWDLTEGNDFSYVMHTCALPPDFYSSGAYTGEWREF